MLKKTVNCWLMRSDRNSAEGDRAAALRERCCTSLVVLLLAVAPALSGQSLTVRMSGEGLRTSALNFHFLTGKPLESLRNGRTVSFDIQFSLFGEDRQRALRRMFERFAISYDVWEQKFSVTRMRSTRAAAAHLSAPAAEAWCLDSLNIPAAGLPSDRPLIARIEVRAADVRDTRTAEDEEEGLSLRALVDIFSSTARVGSFAVHKAESRPFRISDLPGAATP